MRVGSMGKPASTVDDHTFTHEWEHALNDNLKGAPEDPSNPGKTSYSESDEFKAAYLKDLESLLAKVIEDPDKYQKVWDALGYELSDNDAVRNRDETFAGLYTLLRGKGEGSRYPDEAYMKQYFSNSMAVVKTRLSAEFGSESYHL